MQNQAYFSDYGCRYTSVVPCNVFGPNDNYHPTSSHVIPGLIRKLHDIIAGPGDDEGKTFTVLGSGKPLRQFVYSYDLARLMIWVLREYDEIDPIILCVDEKDEVTIAQAAEAIAKAFAFKGRIVFDTTKADGQYKKTASNKKLRKYLPDYEFTDFDAAIKESVEWYVKNAKVARN